MNAWPWPSNQCPSDPRGSLGGFQPRREKQPEGQGVALPQRCRSATLPQQHPHTHRHHGVVFRLRDARAIDGTRIQDRDLVPRPESNRRHHDFQLLALALVDRNLASR